MKIPSRRPPGGIRTVLGLLVLLLVTPPGAPGAEADRDGGSISAAEVSFVYGLEAWHDGDRERARSLFEQAVEADPEHGAAHYWLGLAHLVRGEPEAAVRAIEASLRAERPPPVSAQRIEADLARARRRAASEPEETIALPAYQGEVIPLRRLPRWELRLGAAIGSDSNPALIPDGAVGVLPDGRVVSGPQEDTVADLDLRLEVHPFYDRQGFSLGIAAAGSRGLHDDLDELDLRVLEGVVSLAWGGAPRGYLPGPLGYTRVPARGGPFALLLQAGLRDETLDGESFAERVRAGLALTFREGPGTTTRLDLSFADDDFDTLPGLAAGSGAAASGETVAVELSQYVYLARGNAYLRLGVGASDRDAGQGFAAEGLEGLVELSVPLSRRLLLYAEGRTGRLDFDDPASNPFGGSPREDTITRLTASLAVALSPRLWLTVRGSYLERDVDLGVGSGILDHDRTSAGVGLRWFTDGGRAR